MNEAFDIIKHTWTRSLTGGILLFLALVFVVGMSWVITRPSESEVGPRTRPDNKPARNRLLICYSGSKSLKAELNKSDLERIAKSYNLLKNEKPDFEDILRLNEKCKPSPTAEALVCDQEPCLSASKEMRCAGCVLWVPMRD
jgi:hypothetical protein